MRSSRLLLSAAVVSVMGLSACGTIMNGGDQTVDVVVKGSPTAWCEFTTQHFRNVGTFPNKVTLERSRENLNADCKGEQNRHISFVIPTHLTTEGTVGNVPTGIVPGAAYDLGTGGMWAYPDPIIVDFRTIGDGPKPNWPEDGTVDKNRIGTAQIEAPAPIRMQPVLDEDMNPGMNPGMQGNNNASGGTEVIDAVRLAVDGTPVAVTKTSTAAPVVKNAKKMAPIVSPEDDPVAMKAKQEAKAKAAKEAKRRAAEKAAAAKAAKEAKEAAKAAAKAEKEAREAADAAAAAAAQQQNAPAAAPTTAAPAVETPPSDSSLVAPSSSTTPPPQAPAAATTPATAPVQPAPSSEMPPPKDGATGTSTDMNKYLNGTSQ